LQLILVDLFQITAAEAFLLESLLRVLAIENGSDNSLCLQASQSDSFAGSEAPLNLRP
jgi:hypothetical protein